MKAILNSLGNIPIKSSVIASLYPTIKAKNKKIAELEKAGEIIRLKQGLYVVSPEVSGTALSIGLIANHLYTPSYVSMQSALRFYGLIPEAVYTTQSMTIKHARTFENSLGRFSYESISREAFSIGLTQIANGDAVYIIATPEKALCDLIANSSKVNLRYIKDAEQYLGNDIRFDMEEFKKMNSAIFKQYIQVGKKANSIHTILKLLER